MKPLLLLIIIAFCFGCCQNIKAPTTNIATEYARRTLYIDVSVDKDFTSQELFYISEALGQVNYFFNGYYVYRMKDDAVIVNDTLISNLTDNDLLFIQSDCEGGTLGNSHNIPSNMITLCTNNLKSVNDPEEVVIHELLHSRGGIHNNHKGSILYPFFIQQGYLDCIDQYTLPGILKENYWIEKDKLNYCIIP